MGGGAATSRPVGNGRPLSRARRQPADMASTSAFVDKIDPFAKKSLKKKQRKSQGSSRYQAHSNVEIVPLPLLKGRCTCGTQLKEVFNGNIMWGTVWEVL